MKKDLLGTRMKNYENINRNFLTRRMPTIIRLDGKAFHTFTRGLNKPFDDILIETMQETAIYLCEQIQGCKIAYTQSDEISLLLTDYEKITTDAWFDKNIQKMVSISASMATLAFNKIFREKVQMIGYFSKNKATNDYFDILEKKMDSAMFDSRVFNIPKEDVNNYFLWRQQDCTRNSIQMLGQSEFSQKELNGISCNEIQEMLIKEKDTCWDNMDTHKQRGTCIVKEQVEKEVEIKGEILKIKRNVWVTDKEIPIFSLDKQYIVQYL